MAADSAEDQRDDTIASKKAAQKMMFAWLIAEKIATDWPLIDFAAAAVAVFSFAGCAVARVNVGYFPAVTSALKAVVSTAAGKDTAVDSATVVAAGELLDAFLASATNHLQTPSFVKCQIYSAHSYPDQQHFG
jgi:hypothetical protein